MAQSPLVIVYVPHQIHAPIGEPLEHSTMYLKVAGSLPSQDMQTQPSLCIQQNMQL